MSKNPYWYNGPLDLVKNSLVCISRQDDVKKIIKGINSDGYWAILGPRQIGKTTFLRQIEKKLSSNYYTIYFDFEITSETKLIFYQRLMNKFNSDIPSELMGKDNEKYGPEEQFFDFLINFKPKENPPKIVLLFDEIERIPSIGDFLRLWRKVYHERNEKNNLQRYSVILTGSTDLVALSYGPTSSFDVATHHYLTDFLENESIRMVDKPFEKLSIKIETGAKNKLISMVKGHPQLLQHTCSELVKIWEEQKRILTEKNVEDAIEVLFKENSNLSLLKQDLKVDKLEELIRKILKGKPEKYHLHKKFSIESSGPIVSDNYGFCTIRNEIYKMFIEDILGNEHKEQTNNNCVQSKNTKEKPKIFICYSHNDRRMKEQFCRHLKVLGRDVDLLIWDDTKIDAGQEWDTEIKKNMNDCKIAIFLISSHSLTSDFIMNKEVPTLLLRRMKEGMVFIPVLIEHCAWENILWLAEMEIRPKSKKPLAEEKKNQRDKRCVEIVKEISSSLKNEKTT